MNKSFLWCLIKDISKALFILIYFYLPVSEASLQVTGLRVLNSSIPTAPPDYIPVLKIQDDVGIQLFGSGFDYSNVSVVLTTVSLPNGSACTYIQRTKAFPVQPISPSVGLVIVNLDQAYTGKLYLCIHADTSKSSDYVHQGTFSWVTIKVESESFSIPLPLQIGLIIIFLILSGLFSGLNLGLMALDPMELQIIMKSGTPTEQGFAKAIYPIRRKGNFLLCTLLLGNVLVNSSLTTLLGMLTNGVWAVIGSTAGIVIFGEIVPQAVCSRFGLHVGAHTIVLTKLFMILTFVLSWPISKVLDMVLGKEMGTVYNRAKLIEMLKIHDPYNDLKTDEVNIIQGALELRSKTVEEVMTHLESCFMLDIKSTLDFETMRIIMSTGYTRIPVYEGSDRRNIVSILFVKDLAFVDPDDEMPLRTVCSFYQHPVNFVFSDITLDKLLEKFKTGAFHMAIVQRVNSEGEGDPFYEVLGIITMEDVIEEIIKAEIVDETDVYVDNRSKTKNNMRQAMPLDLSLFADNNEDKKTPVITPQLTYAALRFLHAEVPQFKLISEKVLLRLLKLDVVMVLSEREFERFPDKRFIYKRNKPSDYFVLILEGQVKVQVGNEHLEFIGGPFSYYGKTALQDENEVIPRNDSEDYSSNEKIKIPATNENHLAFTPDFSLMAVGDVKYLKITRKQYQKAVCTTKMSSTTNPHTSCGRYVDDSSPQSGELSLGLDSSKVLVETSFNGSPSPKKTRKKKSDNELQRQLQMRTIQSIADSYNDAVSDRINSNHKSEDLKTINEKNQRSGTIEDTLAPVTGPQEPFEKNHSANDSIEANSSSKITNNDEERTNLLK